MFVYLTYYGYTLLIHNSFADSLFLQKSKEHYHSLKSGKMELIMLRVTHPSVF